MRQVTRKGLITIAAAGGVLAVTGGHAHADAGAQGAAVGSPGVLSGNNVQAPVHAPVNVCGNTVSVGGALNPAFGNKCANEGGGHHQGGHHEGGGHHQGGHHEGGHGGHHEGGHHGGHQAADEHHKHTGGHHKHTGGHEHGGATARGTAVGSPGVLSGNVVQAPVHAPVNVCGNSVSVGGALNPAFGNKCANEDTGKHRPAPHKPEEPKQPEKPDCEDRGDCGHKPEPKQPEKPREKDDKPRAEAPERDAHQPAPEVLGGRLADTGGSSALGTILPVSAGALLGGALLYRRARAARR